MTLRRAIHYLHWLLFFLFLGTGVGAVIAWRLTEELGTAGIIATVAAFFATASTFLERLFPRDGRG